jgi:hypothetical protein
MRRTLTAACLMAVLACSAPGAQQSAPAQNAARATGPLPDGWKARLDDASAKPDAVHVAAEKNSLTFTSGPAGIYYKPAMKAEKDSTLSASFSELKPPATPQPYGLFVAGADLDKDAPRYTAFLIRSDGRFQIVTYTAGKPAVVVDWKAAPQMREPKGVKTSNTLTIRAMQDAVHFLVADREVHQMPRARAGGDGIAGVRIGSGLQVQVDKLEVKKFP